jgi:hypothetical protein
MISMERLSRMLRAERSALISARDWVQFAPIVSYLVCLVCGTNKLFVLAI